MRSGTWHAHGVWIATAALLAIAACSSDDEDCVCTENFATITVAIVNAQSAPVEGASLVVTRELNGDVLPFGGESEISPGTYVVYDDSRRASTRPGESIRVAGTKDDLTFEGVVQVSVDLPCRCHVSKQGGPDTLVAEVPIR